ncbi:MAG: hypothetical protein ABR537_06365 [Gemmatimonadales bacterium]
MHPLLALALVIAAGIGVTRLSRPTLRSPVVVDEILATGVPFVLIGALLGPGLGVLDAPTMHILEPLLALGIGWIGAAFGARLEWRVLRRVPRRAWGTGLALAAPVFLFSALAAWFLVRTMPPIAAAWRPLWPAALTLAAAATMSASWTGPRLARRAALFDTLFGAIAAGIALAIAHGRGAVPAVVVIVIVSALIAGLMILLTRFGADQSPVTMAVELFAVVLAGAGFAYATSMSPFVVCALIMALVVSLSPPEAARALGALLRRWESPLYALFPIVAGALLQPLTVSVLPAALVLAAVRIVVRWATVRAGGHRAWSPLHGLAPDFGFATARQGAQALAVAAGYELIRAESGGGALLTTVLILILVGEAVAAATPLTASVEQAEVT